jgi:hypothetical protein
MDTKFTPIDSDHISALHYDSMDRKAMIRFKNGYEYHIHNIEPDAYHEFIMAGSKGEHFHKHIKDNYLVERVK